MSNDDAFHDWVKMARRLVEMEVLFISSAFDVRAGKRDSEELHKRHALVKATGALCDVAYQRAFPRAGAEPEPSATPEIKH